MSRGEGYKTASLERGNTECEEQGDNISRLEHVRLSQLKDSHSRLDQPCRRQLQGHEANGVPGPGHPNVYDFWLNNLKKDLKVAWDKAVEEEDRDAKF